MKRNFRLTCQFRQKFTLFCLVPLLLLAVDANAQELFSDAVGPVTVQEVTAITPLVVPYITWGGEAALFPCEWWVDDSSWYDYGEPRHES